MTGKHTHLTCEPGEQLRRKRLERGLTQEQLAATIGCSKSHLSQMEAGLRTISVERAAAIERVMGITDASLVQTVRWHRTPPELRMQLRATEKREKQLVSRVRGALHSADPLAELRRIVEGARSNVDEPVPLTRSIPLINNIAAGVPAEFTDLDYPAAVADEYIACPDVSDPDAFAARVVGDSMEPTYREGEIVVFSPALDTPPGSDCFVRLERNNETTFKRIYIEDDGRTIRLQPLNPQYPPRPVDREDVAGMYAAMYVMRRV